MAASNQTIDLLNARCSTRSYAATAISAAERHAILHSAMRAPTAGNMMLYSILEIADQALKDRLAETCDHQPFIARAPLVLVFVADLQKWMDRFAAAGVDELEGVPHGMTPGLGDLMLACCDASIAAQNAVVAAESLGIGSCYIGDIVERGETHAELLGLPRFTFPVTMLCFGHPKTRRRVVERYAAARRPQKRLWPPERNRAARGIRRPRSLVRRARLRRPGELRPRDLRTQVRPRFRDRSQPLRGVVARAWSGGVE